MRQIFAVLSVSLMLLWPAFAPAADEDANGRVREMLRRTQEALREAQSDNAELARAKSDAEQKLQAAGKLLEAAQSGSKATQASLSAKLSAAEGVQAESARKLADASQQLAATTAKLSDTAKELAARNTELAGVKQSLERSTAANESCEAKNITLYGYAEAVLQKYKTKGVWTALAQKEPVLGLKEVEIENVVQEYRLKFNSQKAKP